MLKGIYFMGWYRDMWNYHPSLPMKNMQMVEDITDMHGNMLVWSSLGSGAIGLPYMDREANEDIPPRLRLYGFMNDSEFCEEMRKRGVKVFSVLWKAQLWEFGAEFNEDESKLLSLNILRGASGNHKYVGMSELSTNKYPKIFSPIEKYFPDGLTNYFGEKVGDFLEEFKATSLEGRNILSSWLMAPGHDHKCYSPCSNKDSYIAYLKRDVEMMIDAGAGGLHIDEYDTQKHVFCNAGCFCRECVAKFRERLKRKNIPLPEDAGDINSFDYRAYLLGKGYTDEKILAFNGNDRWDIPLFREYFDMQMESVEHVVKEISTHAKEYAKRTRGEDFPVTANLFQCYPLGDSVKKYLDILAGEKTDIRPRQDGWYRFAHGWLNGKDCCFVEDPNAYVREINNDIKDGISDRFILFIMEPLAHGFHVAFPYGSWLQNQVKDAFWPDLRVLRKLGPWLDEKEALFGKEHIADIAIIYDSASAYENGVSEPAAGGTSTYNKIERMDLKDVKELGQQASFANQGDFEHFHNLTQALSDRHVLYNVLFESGDEPLTMDKLAGYKTVVVPDAFLMDDAAGALIAEYAKNGGEVITLERRIKALEEFSHYTAENAGELVDLLADRKDYIDAPESPLYGFDLRKTAEGCAIHLVNYSCNEATHRIDPLPELKLGLKFGASEVTCHCFPENPELEAVLEDGVLTVKNAGIYTILELR